MKTSLPFMLSVVLSSFVIPQLGMPPVYGAETGTGTEEAQELILPLISNGRIGMGPDHFQSTLTFFNASDSTISGSLLVFDGSGGTVVGDPFCPESPIPISPMPLDILPQGLVHRSTGPVLPFFSGWARFSWTEHANVQVGAEVAFINAKPFECPPAPICVRPSNEIVTSVRVAAVRPGLEFASATFINPNRHSAFTLVNPSGLETATIEVTLLDSAGQIVPVEGLGPAVAGGTLGPLQSLSFLAWEFFSNCDPAWQACPAVIQPPIPPPDMFHGSIRFRSDKPIAVGGVQVLLPEGRWEELPVVRVVPE